MYPRGNASTASPADLISARQSLDPLPELPLEVIPGHVPQHPGHRFLVGVIEVREAHQDVPDVFDRVLPAVEFE